MSSMAVRASNRLADMVDWLESGPSIALRDGDRFVRVEDFERDGSYVVRAELPGVDPDQDIEVSLEGDYLTIRGERHEEIREKNRSEFRYGSFSRSLRMPPGADASTVQATYRDGILEVVVPLGEERPQTQIPVVRTDPGDPPIRRRRRPQLPPAAGHRVTCRRRRTSSPTWPCRRRLAAPRRSARGYPGGSPSAPSPASSRSRSRSRTCSGVSCAR